MKPLDVKPEPCLTCPYRKDVPSGVWHHDEYEKLRQYDISCMPLPLFMCHQRDGSLCGGWLACHDPNELLACRIHGNQLHPVFRYQTDVPVFASGSDARDHGLSGIAAPDRRASKMIAGLVRKRAAL